MGGGVLSSTIFLGSQTIPSFFKTVMILTATARELSELKERKCCFQGS